jgi:hypothetical protein
MNENNNIASRGEQLNEAFEMSKLRKRYKKYINLMQNMLKQFKEEETGVNIVSTFGMNSGLVNSIASFFGFGKNAEKHAENVYIGVKPFAKNVCKLIETNYIKSKKLFDETVAKTNINDTTSRAKAINAATSILYEFFDEYMNADKLLNQGGVDITAKSTMDAKTFKTYSRLMNSYSPKNVGNNVQLFNKLKSSYDGMVQKFDTLGQRLTANFTKYFNKMMQENDKDDEKIANALEAAQVKLSSSWKSQTDIIKSNFPAVVQTILASPEYTKYYEFIIKDVLPIVNKFSTAPVAPTDASANQPEDQSLPNADSTQQDQQNDNQGQDDTQPDQSTNQPEIPAFGIKTSDVEAFVFDVLSNVSASMNIEYNKEDDLSEAKKKSVSNASAQPAQSAQAKESYTKYGDNQTSGIYKFIGAGKEDVCKVFKNNSVTLNAGKILCPTKNELDNAIVIDDTNKINQVITNIIKKIKQSAQQTNQNPTTGQNPTSGGTQGQTGQNPTNGGAQESLQYALYDDTTILYENANGKMLKLNGINEDNKHTFVLLNHCWGNGEYINPEIMLRKRIGSILKEAKTISDVAKFVKNDQYLALYEYNNEVKLNTYGKSADSFTVGNPMYNATILLYESNGKLIGTKYLGVKKIIY